MRLTLDTSCVIDAAQAQPRGPQVDELVDLARHARVGLWITEAFTVDQETGLRPCWLCSWLRWRLPPPSPTPTASSTAAEATKTGALRVIDSEQGQTPAARTKLP
jgi:hypothetical protein